VRLVRYRGVHPQVAVASAGNHRHAYFAAGYMAALNSHPLRRYVKHTNLLSDLRCAQRSTIKGTLKRQPAGSAPLEVGTRLALVEPTTTYKGPKRFGLPYLAESARVTLRGCPVVRGRTKLLALVSISVS
jgi:hypothetical protein